MKGTVLIDAGHFREIWKQRHAPRFEGSGRPKNHIPPASAVVQMIGDIHDAIRSRFPEDPVRWLRTYYYDAETFGEAKTDPNGDVHDFSKRPLYGLDIAWMTTKRIVDIIVLVTNDTDFVAPMKLARTEGVVVGIYCISSKPAPLLREHADIVVNGVIPAM